MDIYNVDIQRLTGGGRIEFVDLAKGVCIMLVVMYHVGIDIPNFDVIRMPLYFIISGLFYKSYGSIKAFCIKKINKILIPFVSFYLISYSIFYLLKYLLKGIAVIDNGLQDVFISHHIFNTPIWFLLCLFWVSIIFNLLYNLCTNKYILSITVLSIGCLGIWIKSKNIWLPMFLDSSLSAVPFYYIGYLLKNTRLLLPNRLDKYCIPISALLFIITFFITVKIGLHLDVQYNIVPYSSYIVSTFGVLAVLFLCKHIKYIPIVSYFGRYSIIILVTHNLVYSFIKVVFQKMGLIFCGFVWFQFAIVLLASCALIPICKKWIPYFVAQKDLIRLK